MVTIPTWPLPKQAAPTSTPPSPVMPAAAEGEIIWGGPTIRRYFETPITVR